MGDRGVYTAGGGEICPVMGNKIYGIRYLQQDGEAVAYLSVNQTTGRMRGGDFLLQGLCLSIYVKCAFAG